MSWLYVHLFVVCALVGLILLALTPKDWVR
jgi:hypothetical protein